MIGMGMRVSIDLDDDDLKHFRLIMREARNTSLRLQPEEIVANAEALLSSIDKEKTPRFVRERLDRLQVMITMLTDHEWRLPQKDSSRVLNALAYFTDPEDLIPDQVPGIGYLDDAIMIELVVRELKHELEAYDDFCVYRQSHGPARGIKAKSTDLTRERWLESRRKALQERMRRRRKSAKRHIL
jgi:uncharacterized membrane protein YkvA (DUF1232 family)